MLRCVLFIALLTTGHSWTTTTTHINVIPSLTDNVQLNCLHQGPYNIRPTIDQLTRIRLVKLGNDNTWDTFAEVILPNTSQVLLTNSGVPDIVASGHLGMLIDTFLSIVWSTASDDTAGSYKCEVDGFAVEKGEDFHIHTNVINITNNAVSTKDLLDVAIQMRRKADAMAQELKKMKEESVMNNQHIKNTILEKIDSNTIHMQNKTNQLINDLKSFQEENGIQHSELSTYILGKVQASIEETYFELRHWPSGQYSLLSSVEGCPDTPFSKFQSGHVKIETETNFEPTHNFSSHLSKDFYERCGTRNILQFPYCTSHITEPRLLWPKGTYCIQWSTTACPTGFALGFTTVYLDSSINFKEINLDVIDPIGTDPKGRYINIHFCCRDDGDHDTPILLPNARPFYLFRFQGKCQSVFNTEVQAESFKLDTSEGKADKFTHKWHADGNLNDVTVELCYYKKRDG